MIHPNDWQEIALLTNADGVFLFGSPANEAEPRIWGKKVIVSPVIAEGAALVGAFGTAAQVYEREGARVTFAESGLADAAGTELFLQNQLRLPWGVQTRTRHLPPGCLLFCDRRVMSLFQDLLERHEQERHGRILRRPSSWNRVFLRRDPDGFLPPARAAEVMGVTIEEVADLARRGLPEWRELDGEVCIQPAVPSVMAVRERAA